MTDWFGIGLLFLLGSALLIVELFLPAHGLLGLIGLGILGFGLYEAYIRNATVGLLSLAAVAVILPVGLVISVKNWHRTPVGRRISPPNPQLSEQDRMPVKDFRSLIGRVGRTVTPLRPVGTCVFDGQRVECAAEYAMIDRGVEVEAIGLVDRTVRVRPITRPAETQPGGDTVKNV